MFIYHLGYRITITPKTNPKEPDKTAIKEILKFEKIPSQSIFLVHFVKIILYISNITITINCRNVIIRSNWNCYIIVIE